MVVRSVGGWMCGKNLLECDRFVLGLVGFML